MQLYENADEIERGINYLSAPVVRDGALRHKHEPLPLAMFITPNVLIVLTNRKNFVKVTQFLSKT